MAASSTPAIRRRSGLIGPYVKPISAKTRARVMAETPVLELASVETSYGLSRVLFGISLTVAPGEAISLMGRNGMGKTTTVRSIMGLTPPAAGSIRFAGSEIGGLPAYRIAKLGLGLVSAGRGGFSNLPPPAKLGRTSAD